MVSGLKLKNLLLKSVEDTIFREDWMSVTTVPTMRRTGARDVMAGLRRAIGTYRDGWPTRSCSMSKSLTLEATAWKRYIQPHWTSNPANTDCFRKATRRKSKNINRCGQQYTIHLPFLSVNIGHFELLQMIQKLNIAVVWFVSKVDGTFACIKGWVRGNRYITGGETSKAKDALALLKWGNLEKEALRFEFC